MAKKNDNILQRNLEEENSLKETELLARVSTLKEVSLKIEDYLNKEKPTIQRLDNDFHRSIDMVKNSIASIVGLLKQGIGKTSCYVILVVISFLILLYLL